MKHGLWFVALLFAGLVIGGLGPRIDLRKEKDKNKELESQLKTKPSRSSGLGEIRSILKIPESSGSVERLPLTNGATAGVQSPFGRPRRYSEDGEFEGNSGASLGIRDGIEAAKEIWEIRSKIAMDNFISKARLNEESAMQFTVLVEAMNIRIRDRITGFASELQQAENVSPESGVRLVNDLTGILVMTYDEADRTLPSGWRENAGDSLDLGDFINPSVAEPLIGVEGQLNALGERRRERFAPEKMTEQ